MQASTFPAPNVDGVDGWTAQGVAAAQQGHMDQAIACFEQAVLLQPDNSVTLGNLGLALLQARRPAQARIVLEQAVVIAPHKPETHYLLGNACMAQQQWSAARAHYTNALEQQPQAVDALRNRAIAQLQCHALDAALADCQSALALDPRHAATWRNLGLIERERGALPASVAAYDEALALEPCSAETHTDRACTLLLMGDFANGWKDYAWRWQKPLFALPERIRRLPVWAGQDLRGQTVLLHSEQGLGDTLQFCRFVPYVAELGGKVQLAVQPPLVDLLTDNLAGAATVWAVDGPLPDCDYRCGLLDLPLRLDATCEPFADAQGYLCTGIQQGLDRHQPLAGSPVPRIGLAWRGSPRHPNDHRRSLVLAELLSQLPPGPQYVCLQVDASDSEHAMLRASANCGQHQLDIGSWRESAALVKTLDLVLTVDTGVAHLGGAMGKATWVLLPYAPDWRWQLHRADSPWYASIQLFRQSSPGDWSHPLRAVARAIANWPVP